MRQKTLLQINVTANWGSTGKIAEEIGKAAMKHGWKSYIAYGRYSNPSANKLIRIGNRFDTFFHFGEQRIFDNEGLCSRRATRYFIEKIEEIKPDVIQLHNIHDHYINYRLLFKYLKASGIPVVWTFHDCWAFTGHCFHFVTKDCFRWKTGCHDCPLRDKYPHTLLDKSKVHWLLKKQLFQDCKNLSVVACSQWMANFVEESFLQDKRIEVFRNGIDLNVFRPLKSLSRNKLFRVLAVSNVWNNDKGFNDILHLRKLLSDSFELIMVGLTEKQVKELPNGITGLERTQNVEELVKLYSSANVFINPTYADTFPTVNLEALACGTPVVTYRTGGSPEAVDEKTGVVIEQGDVSALAHAIENICKSDKVHYTDACRERALNYFNKDDRFMDYIHLYDDLLRENS